MTLVHHAEAIAEVLGKRRVSYGMPVLVGNPAELVWRAFSDIDTGEGALPYEGLLGGEYYIEHIARTALVAGAGTDYEPKTPTTATGRSRSVVRLRVNVYPRV